MEWGSLVGEKAPDLLNDTFLVSSASVLANVGSAKDFSLGVAALGVHSRCPVVIMMDVFVVRDPSCLLASTARPLIASSVPSYNSGSTLWFVLGYCRPPMFWLRRLLRMGLLLVRGFVWKLLYCRIGLKFLQVYAV